MIDGAAIDRNAMAEATAMDIVDGETALAYQAFLDYARMGATRSLGKLQRMYESRTDGVPSRAISTLKVWSSQNGWVERCRRYDAERQGEIERAIRSRQMRLLDAFGSLVEEAIAQVDVSDASLSQVSGAVRTYADTAMALLNETPTHRVVVANVTERTVEELKAEAARLMARMQYVSHTHAIPTDTVE